MLARANRHTVMLALEIGSDGVAPTEFRLFVAGWNETMAGRFLFDEEAARLVMSAFEAHGVDLAIDLEHQMLAGVAPDPTARDARGWFKLAMKPDGSLWATSVTWTPDGAQRIAEKRQRYVSPAFTVDRESMRVTKILNCAITAMPATHDTPALVAASARGEGMLDPKMVSKAIDALASGDADAALEILKGMIAAAAGGEAPAEEPAPEAPAEELAAEPAEEEKPEEIAAASARLMRLTGASTFVDAIASVETFRASHLELETERQKLAQERATLEAAERRKGCVELVTLAGRAPATVWADDKATAPKKYLAAMPIADFREYVADAIKASGRTPAPVPPASGGGADSQALTPEQLRICKDTGCEPAVFLSLKSTLSARS